MRLREKPSRVLTEAAFVDGLVAKKRQATNSRGPYKQTRELMEHVSTILDEFEGSMSTRQVFYQCVSRGAVENNDAQYDRVQRVFDLRRRRDSGDGRGGRPSVKNAS